jgi:hypothetical protein
VYLNKEQCRTLLKSQRESRAPSKSIPINHPPKVGTTGEITPENAQYLVRQNADAMYKEWDTRTSKARTWGCMTFLAINGLYYGVIVPVLLENEKLAYVFVGALLAMIISAPIIGIHKGNQAKSKADVVDPTLFTGFK